MMKKGLRLTRFLIKIPLKGEKFLLTINGLTGSVDKFTGRTKEILEKTDGGERVDENELGKMSYDYLIKHKYIISEENEADIYRDTVARLQTRNRRDKRNIFITINPTEQCNLACSYCVSLTNRKKVKTGIIQSKGIKHIFKILDRLVKNNKLRIANKRIGVMGGEPLMPANYDTIEQILIECHKRGIKVSLVSNGTYVENYLPLLAKYRKDVYNIQLTIDGPEVIHNQRRVTKTGIGYFKKVVMAVGKILALKIPVTVRSNFDKKTIKYLPNLASVFLLKKWPQNPLFTYEPHPVIENFADHHSRCSERLSRPLFIKNITEVINNNPRLLSFVKPSDYLYGIEELLLRAAYPKKTMIGSHFPSIVSCASNLVRHYVFASDGNIYCCPTAVGQKEFMIGQYLPTFSLNKKAIGGVKKRSVDLLSKCNNCRFQFICCGGCLQVAVQSTGKITGVDPDWCREVEQSLIAAAEVLKDRFRVF